jgi:predicted phage terminase large subunit-like protein
MSSSTSSAARLPRGSTPALVTARLARQKLEEQGKQRAAHHRATQSIERPKLVAYASGIAWPFEPFDYFAPYAEALEQAIGGNLRIFFHAPPQHGKTEFTLRALLYWARFFPGFKHAYVTYNEKRAAEVSADFQKLAIAAGFEVRGTLALVTLKDDLGRVTKIKFTSVKGTLTGYPLSGVCVLDDVVKDQADALSPTARETFKRWWKSTARARRHPGTSFIGMGTRWHPDDAGGYLCKSEKFRYIRLTALARPENDNDVDADGRVISDPLHRLVGESLCKWKPADFFEEEKSDRYWWEAMYMGSPVPLGSNVFAEPGSLDEEGTQRGAKYYRELPKVGYVRGFGLDLAYTIKTRADWSVCIEAIAVGHDLYILDVIRKQVEATNFLLVLKSKASTHPGCKMRWYASGTEKGVGQFLRKGLREGRALDPLIVLPTIGDKLVRSLGAAARWNQGRVFLPDPEAFPQCAKWLATFLEVVTGFTGQDDDVDDDVDALAAVHDQLMRYANGAGKGAKK